MDTSALSLALVSRLKSGLPPTSYSASLASLRARKVSFKGMRIVEVSQNAKTGPISTTYMNQLTCPSSCPHLGGTCYAEKGLVGMHTRRIEREATDLLQEMLEDNRPQAEHNESMKLFPTLMVLHEAEAIKAHLTGTRKLRVHVVGDIVDGLTATELGLAMNAHRAKHGMPAWTYTHRWREVHKSQWAGANVWASVEKSEDVLAAKLMGYASALTLPGAHADSKLYEYEGLKIIPCPAQKHPRKVTCATCNICAEPAKMLASGRVLGFAKE